VLHASGGAGRVHPVIVVWSTAIAPSCPRPIIDTHCTQSARHRVDHGASMRLCRSCPCQFQIRRASVQKKIHFRQRAISKMTHDVQLGRPAVMLQARRGRQLACLRDTYRQDDERGFEYSSPRSECCGLPFSKKIKNGLTYRTKGQKSLD
jgi:hypothetical protein